MSVSDTESNLGANQEYLQQKVENIKKAFDKQDKNLDGEIDQNELIDFLDSNCKQGKFDRNLAKKIFSILDIDKNGKITVDEFIKSYVSIIDQVKNQIKELEKNYKFEDNSKSRLELLVKNNLNEVLNDEDLGPNSKFMIEIINIEYLKDRLAYDGILIKIAFGNRKEVTKILSISTNNLVWQQKFEFPVLRRDDIIFEILNIDPDDTENQIPLGSVRFALNLIQRQEEYDVLLEVPDINNENEIYAKINAKIQFIWSLHKFYTDELVKSEERFNNIKNLILHKQIILKNLNDPFDIYENWDRKYSVEKKQQNRLIYSNNEVILNQANNDNHNRQNFNSSAININYNTNQNDFNIRNNIFSNSGSANNDKNQQFSMTPLENKVADNLENFVREKLNYSNVPWMNIFSKLIILIIFLSLFVSVIRSDFVGIIIPLIIYLIYSTTFKNEVLKNINRFIIAIGGDILYDLIWILINLKAKSGQSLIGNSDSTLYSFVYFVSFILFLIKIILLGTLFIIKKKKVSDFLLNPQTG